MPCVCTCQSASLEPLPHLTTPSNLSPVSLHSRLTPLPSHSTPISLHSRLTPLTSFTHSIPLSSLGVLLPPFFACPHLTHRTHAACTPETHTALMPGKVNGSVDLRVLEPASQRVPHQPGHEAASDAPELKDAGDDGDRAAAPAAARRSGQSLTCAIPESREL
eukprot:363970-Chlamydomonas_euryale.AAC.22